MTGDGCVLAIDQGTSGTKALLVRPDGTVAARGEAPVAVRTIGADGVEIRPEDIWNSVLAAAGSALAAAGTRERLDAVALSNQGETVLAWDRPTGRPLSEAICWQDRRSASVCARLTDHAEEIRSLTGLELDPYFSAPKIAWLRENVTADGVVTTTDSWLLHRLTGRFVTDAATASRTLLLDLDDVAWSPRLGELFGVRIEDLPRIVDNDAVLGTTTAFGDPIPVAGAVVDQQAALLAEGCLAAGEAKCTYGTGAFLLATLGPAAVRSQAGLVSCVAWSLHGTPTYCLDAQVYTAGSAVDWLQRIGVVDGPAELDRLAGPATIAGEVFVPALAGLAAPYWSSTARGLFAGLTLDSDRGAVVRAVLEGLAANVAVLAETMARDLGRPLQRLRVDGGLTRSRVLMQTQADLLQAPVDVHASHDATALGASALARLALGQAAGPAEAVAAWSTVTTYEPRCSADQAAERLARWRRAAASAIDLEVPR
jgi:glycerol kinase